MKYFPSSPLVNLVAKIYEESLVLPPSVAKTLAVQNLEIEVPLFLATVISCELLWNKKDSHALTEQGWLKDSYAEGLCVKLSISDAHMTPLKEALTKDLKGYLKQKGLLGFELGFIISYPFSPEELYAVRYDSCKISCFDEDDKEN